MSIWLIAIFSAVIAGLITALFFTIKANVKMQQELYKVVADNYRLEQNEHQNILEIRRLEKELSFQDGIRLARKTDTLYQQILKRCSNKEQFTVMMNGEQKGDAK